MVDQALGGRRGTYSLVDDPDDFHNPQPVGHMNLDAVTHPHRSSCLGRASVDPDVPGPARHGGRRAGLVQADGPQPLIDSSCFDQAMVPRGASIKGDLQRRPSLHPMKPGPSNGTRSISSPSVEARSAASSSNPVGVGPITSSRSPAPSCVKHPTSSSTPAASCTSPWRTAPRSRLDPGGRRAAPGPRRLGRRWRSGCTDRPVVCFQLRQGVIRDLPCRRAASSKESQTRSMCPFTDTPRQLRGR